MTDESHWSIDKRIPIATIAAFVSTIFLQSMVGVWFASSMYSRIGNLTERVEVLEHLSSASQQQAITIAEMRVQVGYIQDAVRDIHNRVQPPGGELPWSRTERK